MASGGRYKWTWTSRPKRWVPLCWDGKKDDVAASKKCAGLPLSAAPSTNPGKHYTAKMRWQERGLMDE